MEQQYITHLAGAYRRGYEKDFGDYGDVAGGDGSFGGCGRRQETKVEEPPFRGYTIAKIDSTYYF